MKRYLMPHPFADLQGLRVQFSSSIAPISGTLEWTARQAIACRLEKWPFRELVVLGLHYLAMLASLAFGCIAIRYSASFNWTFSAAIFSTVVFSFAKLSLSARRFSRWTTAAVVNGEVPQLVDLLDCSGGAYAFIESIFNHNEGIRGIDVEISRRLAVLEFGTKSSLERRLQECADYDLHALFFGELGRYTDDAFTTRSSQCPQSDETPVGPSMKTKS